MVNDVDYESTISLLHSKSNIGDRIQLPSLSVEIEPMATRLKTTRFDNQAKTTKWIN